MQKIIFSFVFFFAANFAFAVTTEEIKRLPVERFGTNSGFFSGEKQYIVYQNDTSTSSKVVLFDRESGKKIFDEELFTSHGLEKVQVLESLGRVMIVVRGQGELDSVQFFDLSTGQAKEEIFLLNEVNEVAFDEVNKRVMGKNIFGEIYQWDLGNRVPQKIKPKNRYEIPILSSGGAFQLKRDGFSDYSWELYRAGSSDLIVTLDGKSLDDRNGIQGYVVQDRYLALFKALSTHLMAIVDLKNQDLLFLPNEKYTRANIPTKTSDSLIVYNDSSKWIKVYSFKEKKFNVEKELNAFVMNLAFDGKTITLNGMGNQLWRLSPTNLEQLGNKSDKHSCGFSAHLSQDGKNLLCLDSKHLTWWKIKN